MIIDCIGCLHGQYPKLEGGDLLIVTGDLTARHTINEIDEFNNWIFNQRYRKKILIAGNHDDILEMGVFDINDPQDNTVIIDPSCDYLCNSGTEFEYEEDDIELEECGIHPTVDKSLKIWGTPHSLLFEGVNPRCNAFMGTEEELKKEYDKIPEGIDILISHTPPYGILDMNKHGEHCGSISLRETMFRVKPKYLICSHIHEQGGKEIDLVMTKVINCSYVNERYQPVNKVMRISL